MSSADAQAVRRLSAEELFREHAPFVARFVARLGIAHDDVDDLVQEVFLTVHRRGGFQPDQASVTTWLADIAVRITSTRRRSKRRNRVVGDEDVLRAAISADLSPLAHAEIRVELEKAERALDALDLDRRAIFVLYELEGESCEAIATGLGVPVGTVYSRLHAARKTFRAAFASLAEVPFGTLLASAATAEKGGVS